jgi:hypothetical protein
MTTFHLVEPAEPAIDIGSVIEAAKLVVSRKLTQLGTTGEIRCADCQASQGQLFGHFEGATRYGDHYTCPIGALDAAIKEYEGEPESLSDRAEADQKALRDSVMPLLGTFVSNCGWCGQKGMVISPSDLDEDDRPKALCPTIGCKATLYGAVPTL